MGWHFFQALHLRKLSNVGILSFFVPGLKLILKLYVPSFQALGHLNIFSLNYFFRVRFSIVDL